MVVCRSMLDLRLKRAVRFAFQQIGIVDNVYVWYAGIGPRLSLTCTTDRNIYLLIESK